MYDPTNFTIRSAGLLFVFVFLMGRTRVIISINASPKACSPTNEMVGVFFDDLVIYPACKWTLYKATQFFRWLAMESWAWLNTVEVVAWRFSNMNGGIQIRLDRGEPRERFRMRSWRSCSCDIVQDCSSWGEIWKCPSVTDTRCHASRVWDNFWLINSRSTCDLFVDNQVMNDRKNRRIGVYNTMHRYGYKSPSVY